MSAVAKTKATDSSTWIDVPAIIVAGVGVSAMGALFYNLLPLVLGAAQDYRGLTDQQIGLLSTAYFLGFTLTTALEAPAPTELLPAPLPARTTKSFVSSAVMYTLPSASTRASAAPWSTKILPRILVNAM